MKGVVLIRLQAFIAVVPFIFKILAFFKIILKLNYGSIRMGVWDKDFHHPYFLGTNMNVKDEAIV